ncbi:MAG TPA: type 1 glutamine amidotransferase [Bryobacteraceae bacterium]|nr:type 1 glutamine amidotransferase [Bryobacteraceae bacterium]
MPDPRVVVLRHVPFEGLGRIADILRARAVAFAYTEAYGDHPVLPPLHEAAGLIVMGGPMSVNDAVPSLQRETAYLAQAIASGKPVLGVCLGAQFIAKALGAKVYRNAVKEIGWAPVYWTEAARRDRLFGGLERPETVLHWHGETFDLPPGAELLARSDNCRNQAFRVGDRVYGLQFHLEATPEMVADWSEQEVNCADVRELATPIDPQCHAARLAELSAIVFGRWCDLLRP